MASKGETGNLDATAHLNRSPANARRLDEAIDRLESGTEKVAPFDPADVDWVMIEAPRFFFEPTGGEFVPPAAGQLVVVFGGNRTHTRGLEMSVEPDGTAIVWPPVTSRVFWCPDPATGDDAPWASRLLEVDWLMGRMA